MLEGRSLLLNASADSLRRLPLQPTLERELLDNVLSPTLTSSILLESDERDDEVESTRLRGASVNKNTAFT